MSKQSWEEPEFPHICCFKIECEYIHTYIPQHAGGESILHIPIYMQLQKTQMQSRWRGELWFRVRRGWDCSLKEHVGTWGWRKALDLAVISWCSCFPKLPANETLNKSILQYVNHASMKLTSWKGHPQEMKITALTWTSWMQVTVLSGVGCAYLHRLSRADRASLCIW